MQPMIKRAKTACLGLAVTVFTLLGCLVSAQAQSAGGSQYTMQEIVDAGHSFFGSPRCNASASAKPIFAPMRFSLF